MLPGTVKHLSTGEDIFSVQIRGNDIHVLIGKPDGDLIRIVHAEVTIDDGFDRLGASNERIWESRRQS